MMPALKLVESGTPEAPYEIDVGAKGWRFEIDYERVEQSDTWALADAETRPWLLMMWLTAWKQRPCGSLPNDDALIAARMGMKVNVFRANRDVLMRGWWLAADGRLYHGVLVEQVMAMQSVKTRERDRKAAYRASLKNQQLDPDVPVDVPGSPTGRTYTGTGTGTGTSKTPEADASESPPVVAESRPRRRSPSSPPCPHLEIVELWNRLLPDAKEVGEWTSARATNLRSRWNAEPKRQSIGWWEKLFRWLSKSPFLMGKVEPPPGRRRFRISLDWLVKEENFAKVIEGDYHEATA